MKHKRSFALTLLAAVAISGTLLADAGEIPTKNGFILSKLLIPNQDILMGGPARDGIPSIDQPKFISPDKADYMKDDDIVLSVTRDQVTRAYPLRILVWHEIVNDTINGHPLLITYCPLCGTAILFDRKIKGKARSFGVSGMLYQSDVLMYDRESESLWSQLEMKAVSGPSSGTQLTWLPSEQMTWKAWKTRFPKGMVLSSETGFRRNYSADAYASYFKSPEPKFPVPSHRDDLAKKDWIIGIIHNDQALAFPLKDLETKGKAKHGEGDAAITLSYNKDSHQTVAKKSDGTVLPTVTAYWFAWQAFYPKTEVWKP